MLRMESGRSVSQWTCVQGVSHSSLWAFFVLFFRKRLTIEEALSHPWITVRLNEETDLAFYREQSSDNILTLIGVLNGKLSSKSLETLGVSEMHWEDIGWVWLNPLISGNDFFYYHNFRKEGDKALTFAALTVSYIRLGFAFFSVCMHIYYTLGLVLS